MVDDNEMVMRSVYLWPTQDSELRQLAHKLNVTKSDLIRSAIGIKLREWLQANDEQGVREDLEVGRREGPSERADRLRTSRPGPAKERDMVVQGKSVLDGPRLIKTDSQDAKVASPDKATGKTSARV